MTISSPSRYLALYAEVLLVISAISDERETSLGNEWPGSMVTKTLKSRVLILIVTTKELYFYADFRYVISIKFSLTYQKLRA